MEFSVNIKKIRIEKNLSQEEVARLSCISLRQYANIENEKCIPSLTTAFKLEKALSTDIHILFSQITIRD